MSEIDLTNWHKFYNRDVLPLFDEQKREEYFKYLKRVQADFYPRYWIAERFYNKIKNDNRFDEELKKFFAFLYSCGFFMEYIITFDEWLEMKNWENPIMPSRNSNTILEILKKTNGIYELKNQLRWLPFINRQDGF